MLLLQAKQYDSFTKLLRYNRKLYYALHNNGILREGTRHMKRRVNRFSFGVLDIKSILEPAVKCKSLSEFIKTYRSHYTILRRYGIDTKELFDNIDNKQYVLGVIKQLMEINKENLVNND